MIFDEKNTLEEEVSLLMDDEEFCEPSEDEEMTSEFDEDEDEDEDEEYEEDDDEEEDDEDEEE